jgi:Staygreen protein
MSRLNPAKLRVQWRQGVAPDRPVMPRRYTLTHSDATGDLFLTIGPDYDREQVRGLYTRLMRDEVLAEWAPGADGPELRVHCHVSGGVAFGGAAMRDAIFRQELPLVLEAFRYGDAAFFTAHPELDGAPVLVYFRSHRERYNRVETWGTPADYRSEA